MVRSFARQADGLKKRQRKEMAPCNRGLKVLLGSNEIGRIIIAVGTPNGEDYVGHRVKTRENYLEDGESSSGWSRRQRDLLGKSDKTSRVFVVRRILFPAAGRLDH
jgi:hypothetical protein